MKLLFGAVSVSDMFQQKIDEIFEDLPNSFGMADLILIVGYDVDGWDQGKIWRQVMQICHQENWKLKKINVISRCTRVPFFGEIISRCGVYSDPWQLCVLKDMPHSIIKKNSSIFSLCTAEVCKSFRKLMPAKSEWMWSSTYQNLYERAKSIIKKDALMKFYNERTTVPWDRCTRCWFRSRSFAGEKQNVVSATSKERL